MNANDDDHDDGEEEIKKKKIKNLYNNLKKK